MFQQLTLRSIQLSTSKTSFFQATNHVLDRLISQTIRSGLITTVAALAELILFLIMPRNFMHVCPYSNVLMSNLNGRGQRDPTYPRGVKFSNANIGNMSSREDDETGHVKSFNPSESIHIHTFRTLEVQPSKPPSVHAV
ncbi:hypothetical protein H0H92_012968 [Tricholoma furcatifolium]|nr:hypothetical protein H0H92_012968 [Tricholoma furcatifolium]